MGKLGLQITGFLNNDNSLAALKLLVCIWHTYMQYLKNKTVTDLSPIKQKHKRTTKIDLITEVLHHNFTLLDMLRWQQD